MLPKRDRARTGCGACQQHKTFHCCPAIHF
jgi:hypothetical protein